MADSDEEYERGRSRDKFPRERSDYRGGDRNRSKSDIRERRTWREDDSSSRRRSRDEFEGDGRRHYSGGYNRGGREWSPPAKRMRRDHWEYRNYPSMMTPYGIRPGSWPMGHDIPPSHQMQHSGLPGDSPGMGGPSSGGPMKHTMLSFKQFLTQQDDNIDESAAIAAYNEYKAEFKRKQMEEFFEEHKEEDWFISQYHPKSVKSSKEQSAIYLQSRVKGFLYLLESGSLNTVSISHDHGDEIIKLMDAAVIKMEGGTDNDLLSLDQTFSGENGDRAAEGDERRNRDKKRKPSFMMSEPTEEEKQLAEQAKEYGKMRQQSVLGEEQEAESEEPPPPGMEVESGPKEEGSGEGSTGAAALPETGQQVEGEESEGGASTTSTNPRPLHLTRSVYIRHIPAKVSANDIIEICRTVPGYLRIAFADPTPERGYERRGWVTYTHSTDIREVTARLSTSKDLSLTCMVNRDLTRRIKGGPVAAWSRKAVHSDLTRAVQLIRFFDEKSNLWEHSESGESEDGAEEINDDENRNPVLDFPESLLSEEDQPIAMATGGEEEEGAISDPGSEMMEESAEKLKLLDRLVWYLRVVHSLDFYNAFVFPSEDCMPHRCCIFTVRPAMPSTAPSLEDVTKYCDEMEGKIKPLLMKKEPLSEADMEKFGKKDSEAEVERFIEMNTEKITENKYLCPLSGKKFKGPEFVKKHIFNKHMEKVDAVKQEAEFYNNYIRDPDRPMPLDSTVSSAVHPSVSTPKTPTSDESPSGQPPAWGGQGNMFGRGGFPGGMGGFHPGMMGQGGFRPPRGRRGRGRRVVNYRDLDAPEETY